ncbi:MAG: hypothetical protein WBG33_03990 [Rhodanobacter sp.]
MNDFYKSGIPGYEEYLLSHSDRIYINRFWLDAQTLVEKWAPVLDRSFVIKDGSVSIAPIKDVDLQVGGVLFVEEEFEKFRRIAFRLGAQDFVVIENVGQKNWIEITDRSFFRFSYPLSITWEDISKSCAVAEDIFLRPIRAYFVVTDNGRLGKYTNNDAARPYDLVFMDTSHSARSIEGGVAD